MTNIARDPSTLTPGRGGLAANGAPLSRTGAAAQPMSHRAQRCPVDAAWLGSARVSPAGRFAVATEGTWVVEYIVGRYGMDDSGAILLCNRPADDGSEAQFDEPAAPGYVSVQTDGQARLVARYQTDYWVRPWDRAILVKVADGSLAEGDTIRITLGDTSQGSPGWRLQSFPEREHVFAILVDPFGAREFCWLPEQPSIGIVPGPPTEVELVLPSLVVAGEPIFGHVRVRDAWWNPVAESPGEVRIDSETSVEGLPSTVSMDDGIARFGPIMFNRPGVHRLNARCGELIGSSNPVRVDAAAGSPTRLLWSDMHGQTAETVGIGTVREYFDFARDRALLDVTAWQGNDFQITDALWHEVTREVASHNQPGRFVTFLGYEWSGLTPGGGDHNIYFLGDQAAIHRSSHWQVHDGSDTSTDRYPVSALWRQFEGRDDVLAIAHVGGRHADLSHATDAFPHLLEVHSHHGTFEWFAEQAMRQGLRVGFVGQSDDHTGRPGLSGPLHPVGRGFVSFDTPGGYTGIYAEQLSREAVWKALKARHCYATTGRRIVLDLRVPGAPGGEAMMGDCIDWPVARPLPLKMSVLTDGAAILDLELRRDDETIQRHDWPEDHDSPWIRIEWSGVRVRGRAKNADWHGRIIAERGTIDAFHAYAFDQPGQGVERIDDRRLSVKSSTSGDVDGVLVRPNGPDAKLTFQTSLATVSVRAGDVVPEPRVFAVGGVNQQVRVSRVDVTSRPRDATVNWSAAADKPGRHAYWVKVVQADGHMAWSSPIFVNFRD